VSLDEEYDDDDRGAVCKGKVGAQSTTYAYTRVDSPAGLLDPALSRITDSSTVLLSV
jgi:hypothetical protein